MAALVERSGVPRATIKYYVREGLLTPTAQPTRTTARYDESTLERLRLITVLTKVGGLSLETIKSLLAAIDDPELPEVKLMGYCQDVLVRAWRATAQGALTAATAESHTKRELIDAGLVHAGKMSTLTPWLDELIASFDEVSPVPATTLLPTWIDAARRSAAADVETVARVGDRHEVVQAIVVITVLGGQIQNTLRMIAQADYAIARANK